MTPERVLARLPGWEGASWQVLDGGKVNHTWLVEAGDRKAVLKIDEEPRVAPFNARAAEAAIQTAAAEIGLANKVLYADETTYLTEYLVGRVLAPEDLRDKETLGDLTLALKRVHGLPLTGRNFDAPGAARSYAACVREEDKETAQQHLDVVKSMPEPATVCCCHNDLVAANIIATPEIHFLDWEYACDNNPLFDLATVVEHHGLSDGQALLMLDTYFDGDGQRWREPLADYQRFYAALLWLWQAAQDRHLPVQA